MACIRIGVTSYSHNLVIVQIETFESADWI